MDIGSIWPLISAGPSEKLDVAHGTGEVVSWRLCTRLPELAEQ